MTCVAKETAILMGMAIRVLVLRGGRSSEARDAIRHCKHKRRPLVSSTRVLEPNFPDLGMLPNRARAENKKNKAGAGSADDR